MLRKSYLIKFVVLGTAFMIVPFIKSFCEEENMKKQHINQEEIKVVGIQVRTNNNFEMNPAEAKIGSLVGKYFGTNVASLIPERKTPGITFCAYTDYESDHTGDYTYFIGEEVTDTSSIPDGYVSLIIPKGDYVKFTSESGAIPNVVLELWQKIWKMNSEEFDGKRLFEVDYEIYDARATDPQSAIVDICIGIKKP
ncbi:AraC family transcriptional regulator [Candidatus Babeliales bacterium]|nr:AraC family transcriptional regulator [Candidatus Babeliales bacterium]